MELFDIAFNKASIYDTLFFNVMSVSEFSTAHELKEVKPKMFEQWKMISKIKYGFAESAIHEADIEMLNDIYKDKAVYYPEFSKIVAISYATLKSEGGQIKRTLRKIVDSNELTVIETFQKLLLQISSDGVKSKPMYFPTLCGHNIISNDIPLFIKRLFLHRNELENNMDILPYILKFHLKAKPWDANTVDTLNLWKFNGVSNTPLSTICDFLGLKRNVDLMQMNDISKYYWSNIEANEEETLQTIGLQSANTTNLVIQLLTESRHL